MSPEFSASEAAQLQPEKPLYPYQQDMLRAIQDARQSGAERAYVDAATGCGKDFTIARDIRDFIEEDPSRRVLYLCHNSFILEQASNEIAEVADSVSHGRMFGGEFQDQEQIVFATFQTMSRPLGGGRTYEAFDPKEFDYVIVNESHHGPAPTYRPVIEYFQPSFRLGATATPDRRDAQDIGEIFGEPVYTLKLEEAIAKGYLARPDYHVLTDHVRHLDDIAGRPEGVSRKDIEEINGMVFVPKRDEEIVKTITERLGQIEDPRTLIFCASIEHAEHFSELLPGESTTLHSEIPDDKEKNRRLEAFRKGETPTLLVVDMLNEGVDVPEINTVVFLRSTESKTVFFQQLGRGLRKIDGKEQVTVLDFVANWDRLSTLQALQTGIKERQERRPLEQREIGADITFNFSGEAMEAIQIAREARERERLRRQPKATPRLDKWAADIDELKTMLNTEYLPRQSMTASEEQKYAERVASGDEAVADELVMRCLRLAYGTAKQFSVGHNSNELTLDDHFHHAVEGIYAGISRYQPGGGLNLRQQIALGMFSTLKRKASDSGLIRITTTMNASIDKLRKAREKLSAQGVPVTADNPDYDEAIAKLAHVSPDTVAGIRRIEQTLGYEAILPLIAAAETPDDLTPTPHEQVAAHITREALDEALQTLGDQARRVLEMRYGLGGEEPHTLEETGRELGLTRERIRQIENQSLKKLSRQQEAQPLREIAEPDEHPWWWHAREYKKSMRGKLESRAEFALDQRIGIYPELEQIAEKAPKHIVGLSDAVLRVLSTYVRGSNIVGKQSLLDNVAYELEDGGEISYNDYVKTLNLLEEHGLIQTARNERGTIIEAVKSWR